MSSRFEQTFSRWCGSPELRRLAGNPLLLTMMTLLHAYEGRLPGERVRLYERCVEFLLHRWRAQPGEVPLRERNRLLLAAGYAPAYGERSLEALEMTPVREALDRFLRAHEPYPALVVDRHHDLVAANDALDLLLDGVAPHLLEPPANALRVALHPDGMATRTLNLDDWSSQLLRRLRRSCVAPGAAAVH